MVTSSSSTARTFLCALHSHRHRRHRDAQSPPQVLGNTLLELHKAVPPQGRTLSFAEQEARTQELYNENVEWEKVREQLPPNPAPNRSPNPSLDPAQVLEEDESLRQPTRSWFDSVFDGKSGQNLLAGVENAALPEAIDRYLEDGLGEEDEEDIEPLVSKDGVKAPSWCASIARCLSQGARHRDV